jgi:hypothetical protein
MLTLTYALVALSVEQRKVKGRVLELQQEIQLERKQRLLSSQAHVELLVAQFIELDEACRARNIDLYVLPAIRAATAEADALLADIDALTLMGRITLKTVHARLRQATARGSVELDFLCDSLQQYCDDMLKRLALEEAQVLPLAQRVISSDEWFDIAARFISNDVVRNGPGAHDMPDTDDGKATGASVIRAASEPVARRHALN